MDFIFENIIWFIVAAAGIVKWLKASKEAREESDEYSHQYSEEEIEEFLEQAERAHPRAAVPPPIPQAASTPSAPPVLNRRVAVPPAITVNPPSGVSGELQRQQALAEQVKQLKEAKLKRSLEESSVSAFEKRKPVAAIGSLRGRLKNRLELRQAFVLKEILEKPVGLR